MVAGSTHSNPAVFGQGGGLGEAFESSPREFRCASKGAKLGPKPTTVWPSQFPPPPVTSSTSAKGGRRSQTGPTARGPASFTVTSLDRPLPERSEAMWKYSLSPAENCKLDPRRWVGALAPAITPTEAGVLCATCCSKHLFLEAVCSSQWHYGRIVAIIFSILLVKKLKHRKLKPFPQSHIAPEGQK